MKNKKHIHSLNYFVLTFLSLLLLYSNTFAQHEYRPFLKQGKTWRCCRQELVVDENYPNSTKLDTLYYDFFIDGDTVINGERYSKIKFINWYDMFSGIYRLLIEKDQKVYQWKDNKQLLLYDFSMESGDSCYLYTSARYKFICRDKHECTVQGEERYFFINDFQIPIWPGDDSDYFSNYYRTLYIEGLGCVNDNPFYFPSHRSYGEKVWECLEDDVCIYKLKDAESYLEDYMTAIDEHYSNKCLNGDIYDLSGRQLKSEPHYGIYIKDGKKYVK